jgi:xylulokinase
VFLPYFSGERTPIHDPHAKGAILGLTLASTRSDVYRALIEGIAFATNHILETYAEAGAPPRTIHSVGGGSKIQSGRRRPQTSPAARRRRTR